MVSERACGIWSGSRGGPGAQQRFWEGLIPCLLLFALLGTQMVAVNSSSPTAACSGPWDARGMEESGTTSDGNAESLYMQGIGQLVSQALWGWAWWAHSLLEAQIGPRTFPQVLLCNLSPSPHPKTLIQCFPAISGQGTVPRNKSGLSESL